MRGFIAIIAAALFTCSTALASPADTVRAAIAADNSGHFDKSLYSPAFNAQSAKAEKIDGQAAEFSITGLQSIGKIRIVSAQVVGDRVLAKITGNLDDGRPLTKVVTFFMTPDGKIDDIDTNTLGMARANGPMQHMPTLRQRYSNVISGK